MALVVLKRRLSLSTAHPECFFVGTCPVEKMYREKWVVVNKLLSVFPLMSLDTFSQHVSCFENTRDERVGSTNHSPTIFVHTEKARGNKYPNLIFGLSSYPTARPRLRLRLRRACAEVFNPAHPECFFVEKMYRGRRVPVSGRRFENQREILWVYTNFRK